MTDLPTAAIEAGAEALGPSKVGRSRGWSEAILRAASVEIRCHRCGGHGCFYDHRNHEAVPDELCDLCDGSGHLWVLRTSHDEGETT